MFLDTTCWGGLRQALEAGQMLETFQHSAAAHSAAAHSSAAHSAGELGIQLASMLHLGACLPNLNLAADAHCHHLTGYILKGGKLPHVGGAVALPKAPGLGVEVDRDKVAEYAEHQARVVSYMHDRDPGRPDWYAIWPEQNRADPAKKRVSA
ncbi:MAG: enolase C-terminal domain-like protein [Tabrizicola sp.]|uniref:enolase C-terminal domain-like protein n=1 Tax=Tabrizicola sp. TaxID=2005166 RepID=UPI002734FA28|nr:enolase C-terminal domain-like protein [Tabrizicola sp.]MDP3264730.1 enolase C-terminal domain-like protein [Tabrizicola sp.]MDP3649925.1 enolase C-terminal domain-like protein [Paracoccaceae bacterium]